SNAEHNHGLLKSSLLLSEIRVDGGPSIKRYRPRARGMSNAIRRPTSHLLINLSMPTVKKPKTTKQSAEVKNV
ncbi:50S ribosomal protein L22, partial [Candidatus Saccharibacteria bacterium]|nr:50S ribosomal protein L22 [Candidatus Saccharibacteria bacterium]